MEHGAAWSRWQVAGGSGGRFVVVIDTPQHGDDDGGRSRRSHCCTPSHCTRPPYVYTCMHVIAYECCAIMTVYLGGESKQTNEREENE